MENLVAGPCRLPDRAWSGEGMGREEARLPGLSAGSEHVVVRVGTSA